ncbi:tag-131 [Symbiodinium pilosum]|uniref:Tag-131 protein n=1 Tax=Symbiodinium pilosum TaxID=2952 RepID=A0A812VXX4_SYMPI|nr:tag-131 [Symbiodinium pilosum]
MRDDDITTIVSCPVRRVGVLIGKAGATINQLRKETGASIEVERSDSKEPREASSIIERMLRFQAQSLQSKMLCSGPGHQIERLLQILPLLCQAPLSHKLILDGRHIHIRHMPPAATATGPQQQYPPPQHAPPPQAPPASHPGFPPAHAAPPPHYPPPQAGYQSYPGYAQPNLSPAQAPATAPAPQSHPHYPPPPSGYPPVPTYHHQVPSTYPTYPSYPSPTYPGYPAYPSQPAYPAYPPEQPPPAAPGSKRSASLKLSIPNGLHSQRPGAYGSRLLVDRLHHVQVAIRKMTSSCALDPAAALRRGHTVAARSITIQKAKTFEIASLLSFAIVPVALKTEDECNHQISLVILPRCALTLLRQTSFISTLYPQVFAANRSTDPNAEVQDAPKARKGKGAVTGAFPRLEAERRAPGARVWKESELALHDGQNRSRPLLIAILGEVYDVGPGERFYAPGEGYALMAGKDASRAMSTGQFAEDATPSLHGFSAEQIADVMHWRSFYRQHEQYRFVGFLEGLYYSKDGSPLPAMLNLEDAQSQIEKTQKAMAEAKQRFKACNSKTTQEDPRTEIWCDPRYHGEGASLVYVTAYSPESKKEESWCACASTSGRAEEIHRLSWM